MLSKVSWLLSTETESVKVDYFGAESQIELRSTFIYFYRIVYSTIIIEVKHEMDFVFSSTESSDMHTVCQQQKCPNNQ